ncbi:PilN domain-containing protein [Prochlorococcus marinus]|uniref:PilN domain-containing protein n=1 Tax=Prochlorococcus marinus TaxID=1219 RepID=UPI001CECEAB2|nr:PilN domain-containing protein [Prochlorococcus marinus]
MRARRTNSRKNRSYFNATKKLVRKGSYLGIGIITIVISSFILIYSRIMLYEREKTSLESYVREYDLLEKKLNVESNRMKDLASFNSKLVKDIANIISNSAFLKEISNIIPSGIKLTSLSIKGGKIVLEGLAVEDKGVEAINRFVIKLASSKFFKPAIIIDNIKNEGQLASLDEGDGFNLRFKILGEVSSEVTPLDKLTLLELGSYGMANRIDYLESQGLNQ